MNFGKFQLSICHTQRLQNHTNIIVGEYEIQTLRIVIVVLLFLLLLFDVLSRQVHIPYYFWTSGLSKYT